MTTRRRFNRRMLTTGVMMTGAGVLGCGGSESADASLPAGPAPGPVGGPWSMPDEAGPHTRTWMAFGASVAIWGPELLAPVRQDLARIARTIARYEPVSMMVRPQEVALARNLLGSDVQLVEAALDDFWMRDSGPTFVKGPAGERGAVDFNFNGWGNRQVHASDARVAALTAARAGATRIGTPLVLEGGAIEVDGHGTAILTESCVLNANRNPGVSKAQAESQLKALLGLKTIIWLPGIANKDITDGHTDFYARFVRPGVVVAHLDLDPASYDNAVTLRHLEILRGARDAEGHTLQVIALEAPANPRNPYRSKEFAAGYVNFYVGNSVVVAPEFGDATADARARALLREQFPGRTVETIAIDTIATGGGGIHCVTQQEPA